MTPSLERSIRAMRVFRGDGNRCWFLVQCTNASWEGRPARQIQYAGITADEEGGKNIQQEALADIRTPAVSDRAILMSPIELEQVAGQS